MKRHLSEGKGNPVQEAPRNARAELCERILEAMREDPTITKPLLASRLDASKSGIDRAIASLRSSGRLERVGSNKAGYWHVIER